jgi:hypothetical protein
MPPLGTLGCDPREGRNNPHAPRSRPAPKGLQASFPSIDRGGPIYGVHNPHIGPAIRFEPGAQPYFVLSPGRPVQCRRMHGAFRP